MSVVLLERDGPVAQIRLHRPEAGNAINLALAEALAAAADEVAADSAIRCVVLTGTGRIFCAGGDVAAMATAGAEASQLLRGLIDPLNRAVLTLMTMPKPLLGVVNGAAAGAGLSLALIGDVVLAARSAHFTAAYTSVGLTPDGGMSWFLPRLIGLRRAQAMILTNQRLDAEAAERLGLVTATVADAALAEAAATHVARLVAAPAVALGAARGLLLDGGAASLRDHLENEAVTIERSGAQAEAQEGFAAFAARRKPNFQGV